MDLGVDLRNHAVRRAATAEGAPRRHVCLVVAGLADIEQLRLVLGQPDLKQRPRVLQRHRPRHAERLRAPARKHVARTLVRCRRRPSRACATAGRAPASRGPGRTGRAARPRRAPAAPRRMKSRPRQPNRPNRRFRPPRRRSRPPCRSRRAAGGDRATRARDAARAGGFTGAPAVAGATTTAATRFSRLRRRMSCPRRLLSATLRPASDCCNLRGRKGRLRSSKRWQLSCGSFFGGWASKRADVGRIGTTVGLFPVSSARIRRSCRGSAELDVAGQGHVRRNHRRRRARRVRQARPNRPIARPPDR